MPSIEERERSKRKQKNSSGTINLNNGDQTNSSANYKSDNISNATNTNNKIDKKPRTVRPVKKATTLKRKICWSQCNI